MELTQEVKAQIEEQKKQCVFCKIISREQESKVVFEDEKTIALLDIYPAVKGHTVFMLKEHYPMPAYVPGDEFKHKFGLVAPLVRAIKAALLMTGMNVFIAMGGLAGQQAAHFLIHFLPREKGDGFSNFEFNKGTALEEEKVKVLGNNFPIMMANHFKRNPAGWHKSGGDVPGDLTEIYEKSKVLYEDEKVLCVLSEKQVVPGHIEIYSKEGKEIENLSQESSAHLFFTASLAATLVFEGLGAQGTNIILRSGVSDDNRDGRLVVDVLPRMPEDTLKDMMWEPKEPSYDLDQIKNKIKEEMWNVKVEEKKEVKVPVSDKRTPDNDEIRKAIEGLQ